MRGGGDDRAMSSMAGKVMASQKVAIPAREMRNNALNPGGNPSMNNGNSPPMEKSHGLKGPSQVSPYMPGPKLTGI